MGEAAASGVGDALAGPLGVDGALSAGMGNAASLGRMSVPPSWTAPASVSGPLASALGGTPMIAPPPAGVPGMPGMPLGNRDVLAAGDFWGGAGSVACEELITQLGRNFQVIYEQANAHGQKVQTAGSNMANTDTAVGSSW